MLVVDGLYRHDDRMDDVCQDRKGDDAPVFRWVPSSQD